MAKVYVGTYKKYNEGSLYGGWLNLADFQSYGDFLKACKSLHKDEREPEFMIQDNEGFPDGLDCLEWLGEQDFNDVKLAMKEEEQAEQGRPSINIIDYSEKAFAVVGDTKSVKEELKKMGGRFNSKLSCGCGWIFSNKVRQEVEKFISSGEVTERAKAEKNTPAEGAQFVTWLDEFLSSCDKFDKEYYKKGCVGAIKLRGGYYLIDKPHIENRFCFHDEGPQYEFYKELTSHEDKLAKYFKDENLATFDNKIKKITEGEDYSHDKRIWWNQTYENGRIEVCFYTNSCRCDDGYKLCTEEEKAIILKGLQYGRSLFEKRLDAYLKRYGTSKLHTWTYWADA